MNEVKSRFMAEFGKKRITDYDFHPLQIWGRTIITRRPLSTEIYSATLLLQKKSMAKERIEPTTYWLGNTKKFQAPARVRIHDLLTGKAKSEKHFTRWSGDKVEFWQNL